MPECLRPFGDFVIYADESGDHNLNFSSPEFPIFVLALCIFSKRKYTRRVVPSFQGMKFEYFGHDMVVFHEREIRKSSGPFAMLRNAEIRESFLNDINRMITSAPFQVAATIIDKRDFAGDGADEGNPYKFALRQCLGAANEIIHGRDVDNRRTPVICESRGRREDRDLADSFHEICPVGPNLFGELPFDLVMADKKVNSTGIQMADLVARPLARLYLDGKSGTSRAGEVLRAKFDIRWTQGRYRGVTEMLCTEKRKAPTETGA